MRTVTLAEFEQLADVYDQSVCATPDISPVCSSSDWILSAHRWLHGKRDLVIATDDAGNWVVLARRREVEYEMWEALESFWGFTLPVIGPDVTAGVEMFRELVGSTGLAASVTPENRFVRVSGIPAESELEGLLRTLIWRKEFEFEGVETMQIDLHSGVDAYLQSQSRKFRRNMRRSEEQRTSSSMAYVVADDSGVDEIMSRILDIERRAYKQRQGMGIFDRERFVEFYREMAFKASCRGELRVRFATCNGKDIAYIFGRTMLDSYRGWQMAYDEEYGEVGIGNLLQLENMRDVFDLGIRRYDLGMYSEYKEKWATSSADSTVLCGLHYLG
ncbi:MAG: CelD/BcsL family acetyltransferase involved in cellulose biosynthesis [Pirellulaceae bacterium]|jgi:CelD/BcsL family acetyltransferase involved in cellulose biosynthesis